MRIQADKPPIVSVIGERIELRKAGKEWSGLCPFHADKDALVLSLRGKGFVPLLRLR
jgi:DNA primase